MELVEGEDLSAHIARGPIPIAEALPIARQIAEALEAAHEQTNMACISGASAFMSSQLNKGARLRQCDRFSRFFER